MRVIHRDIVGSFIFTSDGKLLFGKSRKVGVYQDTWIVPGGGIEDGESKLDAIRRETLEEFGIDISNYENTLLDMVLIGESEKVLRDTNEKVLVKMMFYNYVIKIDKPAAQIKIKAEDNIVEAAWHDVSKLDA